MAHFTSETVAYIEGEPSKRMFVLKYHAREVLTIGNGDSITVTLPVGAPAESIAFPVTPLIQRSSLPAAREGEQC